MIFLAVIAVFIIGRFTYNSIRDVKVDFMYNNVPIRNIWCNKQSIDRRYLEITDSNNKQSYIVDLETEKALLLDGNIDKLYNPQFKIGKVSQNSIEFISTSTGNATYIKLPNEPGLDLRQADIILNYPYISLNNRSVPPKTYQKNLQIEVYFSNTQRYATITVYKDIIKDKEDHYSFKLNSYLYDFYKGEWLLENLLDETPTCEWSTDDKYVIVSTITDYYLVELNDKTEVKKLNNLIPKDYKPKKELYYWLSDRLIYVKSIWNQKNISGLVNFNELIALNVSYEKIETISLQDNISYYDIIKGGDRHLSIIADKTNIFATFFTLSSKVDKFFVTQDVIGSRLKVIKLKSKFEPISAQFYSPDGKYLYYNSAYGLRKVRV